MWKFLYIAVGLSFVALLGGAGKDSSKSSSTETVAKTAGPPPCVVDLAKFEAMKQGMSYFQIVRDVGCTGIKTSEATYRRSTTYTATWQGSGVFNSAVAAVFQNDRLVAKSQSGL
jgi:hypothetical protein